MDRTVWSLMKFPKRGKRLIEEWDLPGVPTSELNALFPSVPSEDFGGLGHTITTEEQQRYFAEKIGEPLDLERYVYQVGEFLDND